VSNLIAVTLMGGVAAAAYKAAGGTASFAETGLTDPTHAAATATAFAAVAWIAALTAAVAAVIAAFGITRQVTARR
jgi:hypothetical protein